MLRLPVVDLRDGALRPVAEGPNRRLRVRVARGLREAVLADTLRRVAQRHRLAVEVEHADVVVGGPPALGDDVLLVYNVHPPNGLSGPALVQVGGPQPASGWWLPVGAGLPVPPPEAAGLDPLGVRQLVLSCPAEARLDVSRETLLGAAERLRELRRRVAQWARSPSAAPPPAWMQRAYDSLDEGLDTISALEAVDGLAADPAVAPGARFEAAAALDRLLGLDLVTLVGREE